jgi:hypothetical protein
MRSSRMRSGANSRYSGSARRASVVLARCWYPASSRSRSISSTFVGSSSTIRILASRSGSAVMTHPGRAVFAAVARIDGLGGSLTR